MKALFQLKEEEAFLSSKNNGNHAYISDVLYALAMKNDLMSLG